MSAPTDEDCQKGSLCLRRTARDYDDDEFGACNSSSSDLKPENENGKP